jgi:hypothetical protein
MTGVLTTLAIWAFVFAGMFVLGLLDEYARRKYHD